MPLKADSRIVQIKTDKNLIQSGNCTLLIIGILYFKNGYNFISIFLILARRIRLHIFLAIVIL